MSSLDWTVLAVTLTGIIAYGLYKSSSTKNMEGYFLSNRTMPWHIVLLSIVGTQASAVTFLSAPGQAFTDGMRFVQYYFGLPIAMVILSITFVPIFNKLKVFTAYEYLEQRFDVKTRTFTSALFLLSRGLSTGISIYAPSIILSSLLGWDIYWTNIVMGGLLIIYTVSGGARAVAHTQKLQLAIIFAGMFVAGYYIVKLLPQGVGFTDALKVSGASGKLNVITSGFTDKGFEWKDRYNIISGIIGGFFLALSYFGTDQSQVGRYLTAKNSSESRLGLLMNGLVKVPMQFLILLLGALLFTFYQFKSGPVFYNSAVSEKVYQTKYGDSLQLLESQYNQISSRQQNLATAYVAASHNKGGNEAVLKDSIRAANQQADKIRADYKVLLKKADSSIDTNDTNYIFLRFVVDNLPAGLVGLLIAIIFLAAWGSIAAALNSLASCTMIDFYCRFKEHQPHADDAHLHEGRHYRLSKWFTFAWGVFCIIIAEFSNRMGSLIEAVNILGSLFYGVILGIFLVAFYMKRIGSDAVFWSAVVGELIVIALFILDHTDIIGLGFLWLNVAGALSVVLLSLVMQQLMPSHAKQVTVNEA
ncbi:sodium:solute symporter [Foetidibacter luteolus]|uniref:sodium:solute symporter n=1 Tax=Foetidibacter luteolus TaxID=2608880 RepID=UPI00129B4106|nr:sodium:solute symporter [Foetidibacter luteolus]